MVDYGVLGALHGAQQGLVTGFNIAAARRAEERATQWLDMQQQAVASQGQQEATRVYLGKQAEAQGLQAQLEPVIAKTERGEKLTDEEQKFLLDTLGPQAEYVHGVLTSADEFFKSHGWELPAGGLPFAPTRTQAPRVNLGRAATPRAFMVNPKTGAWRR